MMPRYALMVASVLMALAVLLGAFGAHGLRSMVDATALQTWQTAVNYHLAHGLALLALALFWQVKEVTWIRSVFLGLLLGILLFSGSLYAWVLTAWHPLVFVTPIGGIVWVVTWLVMAWRVFRQGRLIP